MKTTAKAEDTKRNMRTEQAEWDNPRAAASETARHYRGRRGNRELDLAAAAGKPPCRRSTVKDYGTINVDLDGDASHRSQLPTFLDLAWKTGLL